MRGDEGEADAHAQQLIWKTVSRVGGDAEKGGEERNRTSSHFPHQSILLQFASELAELSSAIMMLPVSATRHP